MIGAFIGDGCYTKKSKTITFSNEDQECVDNVRLGLSKWNPLCSLKLIQSNTRKKIYYSIVGVFISRNTFDRF